MNKSNRSLARARTFGAGLSLLIWSLAWMPVTEGTYAADTAFNIVLVNFTEAADAIDPCVDDLHACGQDEYLAEVMQAAADHFSHIFRDRHTLTIRYYWVASGAPNASILEFDAAGRPTLGRIRIPADFPFTFHLDPLQDDQFDMQVRLFRTTHPDVKDFAFQGNLPEIFEVGYIGLVKSGSAADMLSIVLHEMGHVLGLDHTLTVNGPFPTCAQTEPYFDVDPAFTSGHTILIRSYEQTNGNNDCAHLEIGSIVACKTDPDQPPWSSAPSTMPGLSVLECTTHQALMHPHAYPLSRARPSITDILAIATASGWQDVHFPRKYSLAGGIWHDDFTWFGDRIPEPGNDVYVVNAERPVAVNAFEPFEVANLRVSHGNSVNAFFWDFLIANRLEILDVGSTFTADSSSQVQVSKIDVQEGAVLDLWFDGRVDAGEIVNLGTLRGHHALIEVDQLRNFGTIRANGGTLTFIPATPNSELDLDVSVSPATQIEAITGDLEFLGPIKSALHSGIHVGPFGSLTFSHGWEQGSSASTNHHLTFNGGQGEAVVHGDSTLRAFVFIHGIGRFTSDVTTAATARFNFHIAGHEPGAEHDQLRIDGSLDMTNGGHLIVTLADEFSPQPNDRFALLLHGPRTGEFSVLNLPELAGGLEFLVVYGEDMIELLVGFAGADPTMPNCTGKAVSMQAAIHGSIQKAAAFHGYASVKEFQNAIKAFCD